MTTMLIFAVQKVCFMGLQMIELRKDLILTLQAIFPSEYSR